MAPEISLISTVQAHLPVLPVVTTLVAAPLAMLVRRPMLSWLVATSAAVLLLIFSLMLIPATAVGPLSYAVGAWQPPYGIELRIDRLTVIVLLLISVVSVAAMPYARASALVEIADDKQHLFYSCLLLCLTGLVGMTVTGDAFNVFVFLEISSLSTYALIGMGRQRRALMAAYRYLILGTLGGTFFLIGIGLLYAMTGTLNMADMAVRLDPVRDSRTVLAATAFITVGLGLKLALFPLHAWLPNAYSYAPSAVTVLIAGCATKVAIYLSLRMHYNVIGVDFTGDGLQLAPALATFGLVGLIVCSLVALFENNVKRLLAYSSVAQIGYIVLAISLASHTGLTAGIVHLLNHAVVKAGLFMAVGAMVWRCGSDDLQALAGVGKRMPITSAAFVLGGLALIGVPLTAGFITKWYLVTAAIEQQAWILVVAILGASIIALGYIGKVIEVAYFRPSPAGAPSGEAPPLMLLSMWSVVLMSVALGVWADGTVSLAGQAADVLLGARP